MFELAPGRCGWRTSAAWRPVPALARRGRAGRGAFLRADAPGCASARADLGAAGQRRTLSSRRRDLAQLMSSLDRVFRDDMLDHHIEELVRVERSARLRSHTVNYTLDGRRLEVALQGACAARAGLEPRAAVAGRPVGARAGARASSARALCVGLFEHSPVSLWVEDFSQVKRLIDELRERGITDFRFFTDVHPEFVERCMAEIRVVDVNKQTLRCSARGRDAAASACPTSSATRCGALQRAADRAVAGQALPAARDGQLRARRRGAARALQFAVLPGHEDDWSLVQVSLTTSPRARRRELPRVPQQADA